MDIGFWIVDDNGGWSQMSLVSSPMVAATWENDGSANFLLSQHFLNRPMQVSFKIIREHFLVMINILMVGSQNESSSNV